MRGRRYALLDIVGLAVLLLAAFLWHPWSAHARADAGSRRAIRSAARPASGCIPYATRHVPAHTRCMIMPWQVAEAGPGARSLYIVLALGCFREYPTTGVHQTRLAIRIEAFGWRPALHHGRLDTTCGGGATLVRLRSQIKGRRIEGASWPSPLRFGSFTRQLVVRPLGLPRLLGLSPAAAIHSLWLYGFHWRVTGSGREVVGQVPGWGLVGRNREHPHPYSGVTKLVTGTRIRIPTKPFVPPGSSTGIISGAVRVEGGPPPGPHPRPIAGVVAVFNGRGRLLARFAATAGHDFRLRVAPGRYLLLADSEGWTFCGPTRATVRAHRQTRVTVGTGCGEM